ncbi:MAG: hypothetical protein ACJAXJ_003719 [Colwellia sp.]|jgi:hypothetical protein
MDITTAKAATEYAISTLDGALDGKPTGLSRLLLAYAPKLVNEFLRGGRVKLTNLRHQESLLDEIFKSLQEAKIKLIKSATQDGFEPLLRIQVEQLEKEYRIISTVKLALPFIEENRVNEPHLDENNESESLWWDMFEELASRRNEPWRVGLFARSLALNDQFSGAISLKALWEVAMMEAPDFGALSIFCDSSLYIDGKPVVLMEPDEQYMYEPDLNEFQSGNLSSCINGLIDKGLIQKVATQFISTDPVELMHNSGLSYLIHKLEPEQKGMDTAIRIEGYAPTDHCLDICQLYTPNLNVASERNLEIFKDQLIENAGQSH